MITEYHRPETLEETLALLARLEPRTYALGGGTVLNRPNPEQFAVVDLQALGLNKIRKSGKNLEIGATVTLQVLRDHPALPEVLRRTLYREANYNLRQAATVTGTLVACDGRSAFATVMLAMDAKMTCLPEDEELTLGNFFPQRAEFLSGKLVTKTTIPLQPQVTIESIARTPADRPLVCAALARWPSGRTRLALGGWGKAPLLAMDGNEPGGVEEAARNAYAEATDERASAEYRAAMAAVLARHCLDRTDLA